MLTYRNKFRFSHVWLIVKNSIMALAKSDVPTYIAVDVMNRLHRGEREIVIPMCLSLYDKSIAQYLNEYHCYRNKIWEYDFLEFAFEFTSKRIEQKLGRFKDIEVEVLEFSNTDKRIVIKFIEHKKTKGRGEKHGLLH